MNDENRTNSLPTRRVYRNRKPRGEAVGFQRFRMRVFQIMGNGRLYKIVCFHVVGTPEAERLKVTALNILHPTASPPFQEVGFFILLHSLQWREESVWCCFLSDFSLRRLYPQTMKIKHSAYSATWLCMFNRLPVGSVSQADRVGFIF
jgi:hypothetical protein